MTTLRPSAADRMFFIVGRGRSGTTLLKSLLDAHPSVSVPPESLFIMYLFRAYRRGAWNERRIRAFAKAVYLERRMRRWNLDSAALEARLVALGEVDFPRLCAEVYEAYADAEGKAEGRLLGDKNPLYGLFTRELADVFPRAKFIHIIRDYRDNVSSYQHVPFDLSSAPALAYRWRAYHESIRRTESEFPHRFTRVHYEDLVSSPDETLRRVFTFLEIPPLPALPALQTTNAPSWHRRLDGAIDAASVQQWRRSFSPRVVARIDAICQPLGRELGYLAASESDPHRLPHVALVAGWWFTQMERWIFHFPPSFQALAINLYRRLAGNHIR